MERSKAQVKFSPIAVEVSLFLMVGNMNIIYTEVQVGQQITDMLTFTKATQNILRFSVLTEIAQMPCRAI